MKQLEIPINIILEMESSETLLTLACQGMGITVYPEMFIKDFSPFIDDVADTAAYYFPLNDPTTIGDLVIGYHRERYLSNYAKDFIELSERTYTVASNN